MEEVVDLSDFIQPVKKGPTCTIKTALEKLSDEQRLKVLAAFDSPEVRTDMIAKRLSEWSDVRVGESTVGRHRHKKCLCEDAT